jgi:hypothetical protein
MPQSGDMGFLFSLLRRTLARTKTCKVTKSRERERWRDRGYVLFLEETIEEKVADDAE